ncbi:MAG: aldehyde dehydrogenase family protein [SAR324 cluster bacterium]|nr:aldehyde dehydrogenase family protein [SAR324 cluster bacterium]
MKVYDKIFINGSWVPSVGSESIEVLNPSTEEVAGKVPLCVVEDVNRAVRAANDAFEGWSGTSVAQRAEMIQAIADCMGKRMDELAKLIATEMGMPLAMAKMIQAGLPFTIMGSFAKIASEFEFEQTIGNSLVIKEAVGVCGFITPWNYPLHQIVGKVAPALAAGCTMVLKPSEIAPLNAFFLAEVMDEIGLPAGVFNLVNGFGTEIGEAIAAHPDIDMVSFTGSTRAGIRVAELASNSVKRITQELGGKSANIILEDVPDFAKAVSKGVQDCYLNSGQTCSALTRMLVPQNRQKEAMEAAKAAAEKFSVGNALAEGSKLGPLVSAAQRERVIGYIKKGIEEGATLVTGGPERPEGLEKGFFVKPTVFADVRRDMTIAQEEIFGPVLAIIPYKDLDEAVSIANDSRYGLSGGVWAADPEKAKQIARRLRTGQVAINGGRFNPLAPFGGFKKSGNGREFGPIGLEEYLEVKSLQL